MAAARRIVGLALVLSLAAVSFALLVPAVTGRPVVSYAVSSSMEPTIGLFDAFLVDPFARSVEVGDIIVYESLSRGGPAVHRIVGGDARSGWITQGDANPSVDQAGAEPVVTRDRVLGEVVTGPDGAPLLLPEAGLAVVATKIRLARLAAAVGGPRQLTALAFLAVAAASAVPAFFGKPVPRPAMLLPPTARRALRRALPRGLLGRHLGLALLVVLLASTAWAAAHARVEVPLNLVVVGDPTAADGIRAAAPGQSIARDVQVGSLGLLPAVVVLESGSSRLVATDGHATAPSRELVSLRVEQTAGDASGLQEDALHIWRYPALLPTATILALHDVAPGLPYAALAAIAGALGALWFHALGIGPLPVGRMVGLKEDWL